MLPRPPSSTLFPYTTLFRSVFEVDAAGSPARSPSFALRTTRGAASAPEEKIGRHTSELQSPDHLVCRLLLEKKNEWDYRVAKHDQHRRLSPRQVLAGHLHDL